MNETRVTLLLRHYRKRLGVSQERAAELADLDHSLVFGATIRKNDVRML